MGRMIEDKDIELHIDRETLLQEYIPKDQYEARLKADMAAMLTELQLEIEEKPMYYDPLDISDLIQEKIDALKESQAEVLYDKTLAAIRNYAKSKEGENNGIHEN